jgi:hypothetical protein
MHCIVGETIENEPHTNNVNRENGLCVSKALKPLICSLKDHKKPPSWECRAGFSVGPHRFMHTALVTAPSLPFLGTRQSLNFSPAVPASHRYLCTFVLHCMPRLRADDFSPILFGSLPTTPLPVLHFSLDQNKYVALFRARQIMLFLFSFGLPVMSESHWVLGVHYILWAH